VFDPVDIYGRRKVKPPPPETEPAPKPRPEAAPKPWPKYTARAIQFKVGRGWWEPAEFADNSYVGDIDYVVKILNHFPSFHVTLEASVGAWGPEEQAPSADFIKQMIPLVGRTKEGYDAYGYLMDARARRVRDELVSRGISADRIHLGRGDVQLGVLNRKCEFIFDYK
jgi:hypothetical protein